ncbi:MAG: hypothetical protein KGL48_05670 [Sphingomonadales bacterium]|nr:hypothetical protein [Sphingomonadales bacterium]
MPEHVDIRVSPSLDPEIFKVEGYSDDTRMYVDSVVNAFNDAYVTVGKVHSARELWAQNPSVTPENATRIVGHEADKQKNRVLNRLALAERDLRANIRHAESQLTEPLTEQAGRGTLNTEVRDHAKRLDRPAREAFMREAFERGDGLTLEAVLGAPHYLSGFTKTDHDHFIRRYHERRNPQLVQRLDLMNRVLEKFERALPIVDSAFAKAVGATPSIVARLEQANEQAKAALNIQPTE